VRVTKFNIQGQHNFTKFLGASLSSVVTELASSPCNLIIQGGNLVSLQALLPAYRRKVKLIYIDPPYNTGRKDFKYPDSRTNAEYMSFMESRFHLAKGLLRRDGIICVQCDDNQNAQLRLSMDRIFGGSNFLANIVVKMSEASGVKMSHGNKRFPKIKEYILVYTGPEFIGFNSIDLIPKANLAIKDRFYVEGLSQQSSVCMLELLSKGNISDDRLVKCNNLLRSTKLVPLSKYVANLGLKQEDVDPWIREHSYCIIQTAANLSLTKAVKRLSKSPTTQALAVAKTPSGLCRVYITKFNPKASNPRIDVLFQCNYMACHPCDLWTDISTCGGTASEGGTKFSEGKKPEKLLHRLVTMFTSEGDIVLDYFLGSGTTCAVAHKMRRRYIGLEVADYGKNSASDRLVNVVLGDKSGVSKLPSVRWLGGGSFFSIVTG